MSGELANEGADLALNLMFRHTGTSPTTVYLGLATVTITDTDTLGTITEEDDGNYARKAITFGAPADVGGVQKIKNSVAVVFDAWAADADEITDCFITNVESGTSGTLMARLVLETAKTPKTGETLTFAINALVFGME